MIGLRLGLGLQHNRPPEGGGGEPEWVPPDGLTDVLFHIDLVGGAPQGRAWVRDTGVVAVDTLLGSDANTENGWGTSSYSSDNLMADGYVMAADYLALVGGARTLMNTGGTMRVKTKQVAAELPSDYQRISFVSADGNDAIEPALYDDNRLARVQSWGGSLDVLVDGEIVNQGAGALNVIAVTIVDGRIDLAVNGSGAATGVPDSNDRPPGNPLVAWVLYHPDRAVQQITIYEPLPSTVGLSALSVA